MQSKATTVSEYLASLPADRRAAITAIRDVIRKNIDKDFEEGMQYGMLGYYLPHSKYPAGYHCDPKQPLPFASIASQKNHIGLYLFCLYCDPEEQETFVREWKASGKKLDMGKSCVRVKKLEDVPLDVVGKAFRRISAKRFVEFYEDSLQGTAAGRKATKKAAASKPTTKAKAAAKKTATKKKATSEPAARKAAAKPSTKKTATKKTAGKTVRKAAAKKATTKKAPARKTATRKKAARKASAR